MSTPASESARAATVALHTLFVVSLLWSAGVFAWASLAAVDFGYPWLYGVLDIEEHVARYGPQNRYKSGFADTGRAERLALFGGIADAVRHGGEGLTELRYRGPQGRTVPLLRDAERIHLQSVARLLDTLRLVSYFILAVAVASGFELWRRRLRLPAPRRVLTAALATAAVATLLVLATGPERVFNTLHTWVFPAGEQWFFFYEESLMTTLMKAPDLFGAIAGLLVPLTLVYFALLLALTRGLLRQRLIRRRG